MSRYGDVAKGAPLKQQFQRKQAGIFNFPLYPELWGNNEVESLFNRFAWNEAAFTQEGRGSIPHEAGVYMFVARGYANHIIDHSYILYVGETIDLNRRFGEYEREKRYELSDTREAVARILDYLEDKVHFLYLLTPKEEREAIEKLLKDNLTPPANTQISIIGRLATTT